MGRPPEKALTGEVVLGLITSQSVESCSSYPVTPMTYVELSGLDVLRRELAAMNY